MSAYGYALLALATALLAQSFAGGLAVEMFMRKTLTAGVRRSWIALALGSVLFALFHGYTLELALRTGLYDLRQAVLGGLISILYGLGTYGLRRQSA
jgi:membrane protease YdiL (CAAX protease family)